MSYAAPFNLLLFHVSGSTDSVATRLTWPLASSLVIHVVMITLVGLRFAPSFEQPSGSYQVALVTLPEISMPPARPRVPELVADSLMGALESVVVPKPRAMTVPQKAAISVSPPPLGRLPALEVEAQTIQAPPQPPQLASGPETRKSTRSTPPPSIGPLAQTLKQAVSTLVVPKKQTQASTRVTVSPTVKSDSEQKQAAIKTAQSSGITLPSQSPRLAVVTPLSQKREPPVQIAQKSLTAESLTQEIQAIRIPESKKSHPAEIVSRAIPFLPEVSPEDPKVAGAQDLPSIIVPPQAPPLAKVHIEQEPVPLQPMTTPKPEPDALKSKIADLPIPQGQTFEAGQPGAQQAESGTKETLTVLRVAGSCKEGYWAEVVKKRIDKKWYTSGGEFQRRQPLQVVLAFRVERNGQVTAPTVVQSSGNEYFDLAAQRAVVASSPLPAFPEKILKPSCTVQHTFTGPPN